MQLYNKSKRTIDGHKPGTLFEVLKEDGEKLLNLYGKGGEIIKPEGAEKMEKENEELKAKIAELEAKEDINTQSKKTKKSK